MPRGLLLFACCWLLAPGGHAPAQSAASALTITANVRTAQSATARAGKSLVPPAVIWLRPMNGAQIAPSLPRTDYVLTQKDKSFLPHLLVIPVGSSVHFPNRDPFFHNVFSLFDGKRFDLGLYESGQTRNVVFPREGVSYIFCNIHPEMSAVVIAVSTPLFSIANAAGDFTIAGVAPGEYELHLWVEGVSQATIDAWTRKVRLSASHQDLNTLEYLPSMGATQHTNKFGQPYAAESNRPY